MHHRPCGSVHAEASRSSEVGKSMFQQLYAAEHGVFTTGPSAQAKDTITRSLVLVTRPHNNKDPMESNFDAWNINSAAVQALCQGEEPGRTEPRCDRCQRQSAPRTSKQSPAETSTCSLHLQWRATPRACRRSRTALHFEPWTPSQIWTSAAHASREQNCMLAGRCLSMYVCMYVCMFIYAYTLAVDSRWNGLPQEQSTACQTLF